MSFHGFMVHIRLKMVIILIFSLFSIFWTTKNTKNSVKSSKLVGNRQTIHIRVEELKEIFFHTLSAIKTPKMIEISTSELNFIPPPPKSVTNFEYAIVVAGVDRNYNRYIPRGNRL